MDPAEEGKDVVMKTLHQRDYSPFQCRNCPRKHDILAKLSSNKEEPSADCG